jgi:3-dehydroquinate synthase
MNEWKMEAGLRHRLGGEIERLLGEKQPTRIGIITDKTVGSLYLNEVEAELTRRGFSLWTYQLTPGDGSKNMNQLHQVLCEMAEHGLNRHDLLIALGGGVPGDFTGFAASIYMRGMSYIQVPTTLLAAIDSSVGGKTGVNLDCGKNMAGTFWNPLAILTDPEMLRSLSPAVYREGLAEGVKYGVIGDMECWGLMKKMVPYPDFPPEKVQPEVEKQFILRCVQRKQEMVARDYKDLGLRMLLNFGHTVGHAIEKWKNYQISHGEAVAMGMILEARAAYRMGWSKEDLSLPIQEILLELGFSPLGDVPGEPLSAYITRDKKHQGHGMTLVVPVSLGSCELKKVRQEEMAEFCSCWGK